jgi:hypothetical protein
MDEAGLARQPLRDHEHPNWCWVYNPDGQPIGRIEVGEGPANCAFGDDDRRTLYVTAQTPSTRVRLKVPDRPSSSRDRGGPEAARCDPGRIAGSRRLTRWSCASALSISNPGASTSS